MLTLIIRTFILLNLLTCSLLHSQKQTYLDINGDALNQQQFRIKLWDTLYPKSSWSFKNKDSTRTERLVERYFIGKSKYDRIAQELKSITNRTIPDSTTIIIDFSFKNDLCDPATKDNKWTKYEMNKRKSFIRSIKKKLNKQNIYYIKLVEAGIELKNRPEKKSEFIFTDKNHFFREKVFISPANCGSHALIRQNGEILIETGEIGADWFSENSISERWKRFFKDN
jgi:hypothetical protein